MADHYSIHYVPTVRGAVIGFDHFTRDTEYVAVALESLDVLDGRIQRGVDRVYTSVDLLEKPRELYESLPDSARRNLLGAFFTKLNVLITEDGLHLTSERTEINEAFHEWQTQHRLISAAHTPTKTKQGLPHSCGRPCFGAVPTYSVQRFE